MSDLDAHHYRKCSSTQYRLAHEILDTIDFKGNETILDIGCGEGRLTAELSKCVPRGHVIGIDPSPSMINLAASTFQQKEFPNLIFKQASAEKIYLERSVDIVLVMNTLHWVRDPWMALRNIASLLKPGGALFILTYPKESPYWTFLEETLKEREWSAYADRSAFNTILTAKEYKKMIEECGLVVEVCSAEENIAIYSSVEDFSSYIKGWLNCYLPLPHNLENAFLQQAAKKAQAYSLGHSLDEIQLPYLKLRLKARSKIP